MRRVALILVAVLILGGCGGAVGGNSGALATTGGSTASSATATRAAPTAAGGGSYCREWQVRSPTINRLAMKAAMGPQPAGVEAALDGLDRERSALAAAAPDELKGEYRRSMTVPGHRCGARPTTPPRSRSVGQPTGGSTRHGRSRGRRVLAAAQVPGVEEPLQVASRLALTSSMLPICDGPRPDGQASVRSQRRAGVTVAHQRAGCAGPFSSPNEPRAPARTAAAARRRMQASG
jgi:hypothetical protein